MTDRQIKAPRRFEVNGRGYYSINNALIAEDWIVKVKATKRALSYIGHAIPCMRVGEQVWFWPPETDLDMDQIFAARPYEDDVLVTGKDADELAIVESHHEKAMRWLPRALIDVFRAQVSAMVATTEKGKLVALAEGIRAAKVLVALKEASSQAYADMQRSAAREA